MAGGDDACAIDMRAPFAREQLVEREPLVAHARHGFGSGVDDRLKVFDAIGGAHKVLAVYRHGTHNVFTDHRYFDSREVSEQVKQATEALSLAFIDTAYGQSTAELARWQSGHRALLARYDAR